MISPTLGNELAYRQGIALSFKSDIASQQQAFQTFKSLADSGISKAQMKTADAYRFGKGVPKDFTAALNYYRLAATDAQYLEIVSQKLSAMAKEGWVPSVSDYFRYTPPSNRRA